MIENLKNLVVENKLKKLMREVILCKDISDVDKYRMLVKLKHIIVCIDEFKYEFISKKTQLIGKINQHLKGES